MGTAARLVPAGGQLCFALSQVEPLLLGLAVWKDGHHVTPLQGWGALGGRAAREALGALGRVRDVIAPSHRAGATGDGAHRLLGPDGRSMRRQLRVIRLDDADVATLTGVARVLGLALATDLAGQPAEAVTTARRGVALAPGAARWAVESVESLARALGVLQLEPTHDTALLTKLLADAGSHDVVLDPVAEAAYQRTIARWDAIWAHGTDLALPLH